MQVVGNVNLLIQLLVARFAPLRIRDRLHLHHCLLRLLMRIVAILRLINLQKV